MSSMKAALYETKDTVTIRAKYRNEEGRTKVEKVEVHTHNVDTIKHIERKLVDTGVQRLERHPADGKGGVKRPPPKKGHGGKFTWEGPDPEAEYKLEAEGAIDEGDPNYVREEEESEEMGGREEDLVKGEVEVAKAAEEREGIARIDVDPGLNV